MASRNVAAAARKRRRNITLLWAVGVSALVIGLIYKEQIALLYVLASLALTGLLVILMVTDLSSARATAQPAPYDDAAAAADGVTAASDARRRSAPPRR